MPPICRLAFRSAFLGLIAAALMVECITARALAQGKDILVFGAARLKNALDQANALYLRQTNRKVVVSYGASSALARQIENGAPADLFISADLEWMDYLAARRLIRTDSRINLLTNRLVLIAPANRPVMLTIAPRFPLRATLGESRLSIADPDAVPAGKYARAALITLGVWNDVSDKLAPAENVRAALVFVSRGEAPLGIVYRTDALADPGVRIVDTFPENTHPRITYPAALTTNASEAAARVLSLLRSPASRTVFVRQG